MATSKTTNTYNRQNWEDADFPILCPTCLGDNPYIRMTKEKYGKECKICVRPFTVFRWCPGARMRFKKTEVCQTCSRLKNVCQTCLLDLEYGLPIQVRDAALKVKDDLPRSDVNKEYYVQNIDKEIGNIDPTSPAGAVGKSGAASDLLMKLARTSPYYKRNRPHICSFWVKAAAMPVLEPPEDKSITTLYIGGLGDVLTEKQLRDHFYQYGEIRSVTMVPRQQCAFIQYTQRSAAEAAAERTFNKLILGGRRLTIKWGRSQGRQTISAAEATREMLEPVPGLPKPLPPAESLGNNFFNLQATPPGMIPPMMIPPPPVAPQFMFPSQITAAAPTPIFPPGTAPIHYPSQDPSRMGASQGIGKPWPED
ncbi:hypothetical protein PV326_004600 [Microctonus aethiopoides]|nr:hypothetical protein PV326_004600 [Microctonus aethiopoides]